MKEEDPLYNRFLGALKHETKHNWYRQQSALASEAAITPGYLTDILKERTNPSFKVKNALAKACGYEYEEFLAYGRTLIEGGQPKKPVSPPKIKTKSESKSTPTSKRSDQMGDTMMEDLVQILKEQVAELRSEKDELKKERIELNQELKDQRQQIDDLYSKNVELAKQLGEANQALNRIKAQQDNGLASPRKPASNQ